ncbi:MAG: hypothetical protein ABSA58_19145, partial [Acetobacteraceae bacterium]
PLRKNQLAFHDRKPGRQNSSFARLSHLSVTWHRVSHDATVVRVPWQDVRVRRHHIARLSQGAARPHRGTKWRRR